MKLARELYQKIACEKAMIKEGILAHLIQTLMPFWRKEVKNITNQCPKIFIFYFRTNRVFYGASLIRYLHPFYRQGCPSSDNLRHPQISTIFGTLLLTHLMIFCSRCEKIDCVLR